MPPARPCADRSATLRQPPAAPGDGRSPGAPGTVRRLAGTAPGPSLASTRGFARVLQVVRRLLLTALVGLGGFAAVSPAWAQGAASGPAWASLTPAQRTVLAPLQRDWHQIDASRKTKWLEVAARFPAMPPEEQARVQERMAEWARMTPAERGRARLNFQEAKQLSPAERQKRWEAYQALPEDRRRALAERAKAPAEAARPPRVAAARSADAAASRAAGPGLPAGAASKPLVKPVAPTVVQAKPGATTTLMTQTPRPPAHQRPGGTKIAGDPAEIDRTTLLPQRGPQASASAPRSP